MLYVTYFWGLSKPQTLKLVHQAFPVRWPLLGRADEVGLWPTKQMGGAPALGSLRFGVHGLGFRAHLNPRSR